MRAIWSWFLAYVLGRDPGEFLIRWGDGPDKITTHDMYTGCILLGETGSGKTSGPGRALQKALLAKGYGMLVIPAKISDGPAVVKMCSDMGRKVILFGPGHPHRFDPVGYELSQGVPVEAVAAYINTLVRLAARQSAGGTGDDGYWQTSCDRATLMQLSLAVLARGTASLRDLYRLVNSLPRAAADFHDPAWLKSFCARCVLRADRRARGKPDAQRRLRLVTDWLEEWAGLAEKTRTIVQSCLSNTFFRLVATECGELLCGGTTVSPDDLMGGAVLVVATPYLQFREAGQLTLQAWKLAVQRAVLRRKMTAASVPVVVWADECQFTASEEDKAVQTVARESKLINVNITQNIPVLYDSLGGQKAQHMVDAWLGCLGLKIFCANAEPATVDFAVKTCGQRFQAVGGGTIDTAKWNPVDHLLGSARTGTHSYSMQLHPNVPASTFGRLRKGAKENHYLVDCIIYYGGKTFSNGKPYTKVTFDQRR